MRPVPLNRDDDSRVDAIEKELFTKLSSDVRSFLSEHNLCEQNDSEIGLLSWVPFFVLVMENQFHNMICHTGIKK